MNNFDLILRNVTQRKMRTGLTIFGIALGIFAIMVMGGMSEYFDRHANRGLDLMSDKIYIVPESGFFGGGLVDSMVSKVRRIPGVFDAYGLLWMPYDMESLGMFGAFVVGIAPEKQEITLKNIKLTEGRLLVPGDSYRAVVGSNVARQYGLNVGDELEVKSKKVQRASTITTARNFTVVGIMEFTSSDFDYIIGIPIDIAKKFYEMDDQLTYIWAVPEEGVDAEDLSRRIELGVENIKTISPQELRKQSEQMLMVMNLITISAAVLAAIIGSLSVMNTMLMSVSERTREFGLMKAMGAEVRDILLLTMGESALMGVLGGIIGIAGGSIFIYFMNEYLATMGTVLFAVTYRLVAISLVFATFLGTVSGILPAYRAAKMRPMEAMKYG
ncbi:MAG: ABC transporter permease [Candidatus Methanoperedens sp.]|nr:MAG: ABC transporter permease [Candidatus Methanoperedens sp.]